MDETTARDGPAAKPPGGVPLPLLLLPGMLCDQRLWQQQIDGLTGQALCTVADLSGDGSIAGMAHSALAQAPAERFALAGLSLGGYVALEIMRLAPERVFGLALLDTSARPDTPDATAARHALMSLAGPNLQKVINALLPKLVHPSQLADPAIVAVITAMARSAGRDSFVRQIKAIIGRADSRPSLGRIACRTLVLCGREDVITPVEVHEELTAGIPLAALVVIEGSGHLSPLDQPRLVTEAMAAWLERLDESSASSQAMRAPASSPAPP